MKSTLKIFAIIMVVLFVVQCNQIENLTTSASKLILIALTGNDANGDAGSPVIFSDIITDGSYFNDNCEAELTSMLINPAEDTTLISYYQDILVDQIDVRFTREDQTNPVEGLTVPYSWSQPVHQIVSIESNVKLPFVIIRHAAKWEAPLVYLQNAGQEKILRLIAHITIHGKDLAGHRVQPATGWITVVCADFGDEGGDDGGGGN